LGRGARAAELGSRARNWRGSEIRRAQCFDEGPGAVVIARALHGRVSGSVSGRIRHGNEMASPLPIGDWARCPRHRAATGGGIASRSVPQNQTIKKTNFHFRLRTTLAACRQRSEMGMPRLGWFAGQRNDRKVSGSRFQVEAPANEGGRPRPTREGAVSNLFRWGVSSSGPRFLVFLP